MRVAPLWALLLLPACTFGSTDPKFPDPNPDPSEDPAPTPSATPSPLPTPTPSPIDCGLPDPTPEARDPCGLRRCDPIRGWFSEPSPDLEGVVCGPGFCMNGACCGDGIVQEPEECDGEWRNSDSMPDACRRNCQGPSCGDGVIDPGNGEQCEEGRYAPELGPATCEAQAFRGGELACTDCRVDLTGCTGPLVADCGDGSCDMTLGEITLCPSDCVVSACGAAPPAACFVRVPAGRFSMGASPGDGEAFANEMPAHVVEVTRALHVAATETTAARWAELMGTREAPDCPQCPVTEVSFWDALSFCNALSLSEGRDICVDLGGCTGTPGVDLSCDGASPIGSLLDCEGYRLPTEAEWELAARAGNPDARYGPLDEIAWWGVGRGAPSPVAALAPNAWGIYDTLGNVFEWTWDHPRDYAELPEGEVLVDPTGAAEGTGRAGRGGGWLSETTAALRVSIREAVDPSFRSDFAGFRCVRSALSR